MEEAPALPPPTEPPGTLKGRPGGARKPADDVTRRRELPRKNSTLPELPSSETVKP